jgi:hypothetical protein
VTGRGCSAEAATGAMTGKTTGATGAMTGKTAAAAGQGCSGYRELDDQAGHAAVSASGAAATSILAAFWHRKPIRDNGRRTLPDGVQ